MKHVAMLGLAGVMALVLTACEQEAPKQPAPKVESSTAVTQPQDADATKSTDAKSDDNTTTTTTTPASNQ